MSTRKRTNRTSKRPQKPSQTVNNLIALVVVILTVAGLIWILNLGQKPAAEADATGQPAVPTQQAAASGVNAKQYASEPPMTIDKNKQYFATVKMATGGEFVIQLYPDKAPITVNSFVFLAREGFFNGITFHRVLDGFMAQGGDPTGTGTSGPGYKFVDENSDLTFDKAGIVAMANSGPNTNGSQFFITFAPVEHLNGIHTIFGQVTSGMDVVNNLTRRNPQANPNAPPGDAIESIIITEK